MQTADTRRRAAACISFLALQTLKIVRRAHATLFAIIIIIIFTLGINVPEEGLKKISENEKAGYV